MKKINLKTACILTSLLIFSVNSWAQSSCTQQVSSSELMAEVARRLGVNSPIDQEDSGGLTVTAACVSGSNLTLSVWNAQTFKMENISVDISFNSECARYKEAINLKAKILVRGGVVAVCRGSRMTQILIGQNGKLQKSEKDYGFNSDCVNDADAINK